MRSMWKRPLQKPDSGVAWPCVGRPKAQDAVFVADPTLAGHVGHAAPIKDGALNQVCNGMASDRSTFEDLYGMMNALLSGNFAHAAAYAPEYVGSGRGDVRHSQAAISKTATLLGYVPTHCIDDGWREAVDWTVHAMASGTEDRPMFSK